MAEKTPMLNIEKRKEAHRLDRKRQIIDVSLNLFEKKGFKSTTIRDIAKEVGLTQGSLYYYFRSKEEILYEMIHDYLELITKRIKIITAERATGSEKIRSMIKEIMRHMGQSKAYITIFFKEKNLLPENLLNKVIKKRDAIEQIVVDTLIEGMKSGEFKTLDPKMAAFAMLGMCNWASQWFKEGGRLTVDEISEIFTEIFLNGIVKK